MVMGGREIELTLLAAEIGVRCTVSIHRGIDLSEVV